MYAGESFGASFQRGYRALPSAIRIIITANVAVFVLLIVSRASGNDPFVKWFGFYSEPIEAIIQPWRFFTYTFLHAGFFHLLFNMLWLWWMGRSVESSIGSQNFWVLYIASGVGGALLSVLLTPIMGAQLIIGASGAVFGVMVGFAMLYPTAPIMMFLLPPIEARYVVAGLIVFDVLFLGSNDNTARLAHLGGAGMGYLMMKYIQFGYEPGKIVDTITSWFQKSQVKVKTRSNMRIVEDAEVIEEVEQTELDRILDKISKKGYDGLTEHEKKVLFELSKKK